MENRILHTISDYKKDELFSKQEYQRISIYSELCKKFRVRALFIAAVNDKYVHIMSTHIATSFFWRGFFHSLHIHENKKITLCVFSCCLPVIKMDVAKPDYLDTKFKSNIYKTTRHICLMQHTAKYIQGMATVYNLITLFLIHIHFGPQT